MFALLAGVQDLQKTITWTQESATTQGGPYGCMATYSNWNCVNSPAPSASPSRHTHAKDTPAYTYTQTCTHMHTLCPFAPTRMHTSSMGTRASFRRRESLVGVESREHNKSRELTDGASLLLVLRVCVTFEVAGEYGAYAADARADSKELPAGDFVYWEHDHCNLDMKGGTCR